MDTRHLGKNYKNLHFFLEYSTLLYPWQQYSAQKIMQNNIINLHSWQKQSFQGCHQKISPKYLMPIQVDIKKEIYVFKRQVLAGLQTLFI